MQPNSFTTLTSLQHMNRQTQFSHDTKRVPFKIKPKRCVQHAKRQKPLDGDDKTQIADALSEQKKRKCCVRERQQKHIVSPFCSNAPGLMNASQLRERRSACRHYLFYFGAKFGSWRQRG